MIFYRIFLYFVLYPKCYITLLCWWTMHCTGLRADLGGHMKLSNTSNCCSEVQGDVVHCIGEQCSGVHWAGVPVLLCIVCTESCISVHCNPVHLLTVPSPFAKQSKVELKWNERFHLSTRPGLFFPTHGLKNIWDVFVLDYNGRTQQELNLKKPVQAWISK